MAVSRYELVSPPGDPRARELWIQHAAGFVLVEDVYRAALSMMPPGLTDEQRSLVEGAARATLYCLMQVVEGVTGCLQNELEAVDVSMRVTYSKIGDAGEAEEVHSLDLRDGDGVCMGVHGWLEGDFGDDPVARPRE